MRNCEIPKKSFLPSSWSASLPDHQNRRHGLSSVGRLRTANWRVTTKQWHSPALWWARRGTGRRAGKRPPPRRTAPGGGPPGPLEEAGSGQETRACPDSLVASEFRGPRGCFQGRGGGGRGVQPPPTHLGGGGPYWSACEREWWERSAHPCDSHSDYAGSWNRNHPGERGWTFAKEQDHFQNHERRHH